MTYGVLKLRSWISVVALCCLLSGCNLFSANASPEEQFQVSVSGLAGSEAFSFVGKAALRRNEQRQFEQHFSYEGQLTNHDELAMQSTLPVQTATKASVSVVKKEKNSSNPISADFRRMNGGWIHTSNAGKQAVQALVRFNPLDQLEEISGLTKTITEEVGASRGTRVLRIELNSEDAHKWLVKQLSREMDGLREELDKQQTTYSLKVRSELESIWQQGDKQLQTMLKQAKVGTVYHMTIDSRSDLPLRLTSESKMSYLDLEGNEQSETVVNDVTFQL
ncbi:hypothetical protein [Paenibacillus antarcticus]|uniref:Uncharacterized protein n=1 Tax=Paenibacillus antarcticus TaxID=253703 RepID=A0A168P8H7_9BACL|nr:hypothetical protein [Paenibacillus antarcticus]OAB46499.1 hypothetical protein PBAT_10790 [Paenibacillus antarcticus]